MDPLFGYEEISDKFDETSRAVTEDVIANLASGSRRRKSRSRSPHSRRGSRSLPLETDEEIFDRAPKRPRRPRKSTTPLRKSVRIADKKEKQMSAAAVKKAVPEKQIVKRKRGRSKKRAAPTKLAAKAAPKPKRKRSRSKRSTSRKA